MSAPRLSEGTKTVTLTEVNESIVRVAYESIVQEEEWEFFCECGREDCREHVLLTLAAYAAIHDDGRAVLAPGHQLSQVERARRLRLESEALQRQAGHQVERAKRNMRA